MKTRASAALLTLAALGMTGCASGAVDGTHKTAVAHPTGSSSAASTATAYCERAWLRALQTFGAGFAPQGSPRLEASFASTAPVLNRWTPGNGEQLANLWPSAPGTTFVAVCYFGGHFTTKDGRAFNRAVIETDGANRAVLVVAGDPANPVPISPPPS